MIRFARHRLLVSLTVIASLLFQQVAVAAYACDLEAPRPVSAHCAEMGMASEAQPAAPLCEKHCTPDRSVVVQALVFDVPALSPPPEYALVRVTVETSQFHDALVPDPRSNPPPRLRYCSLLI